MQSHISGNLLGTVHWIVCVIAGCICWSLLYEQGMCFQQHASPCRSHRNGKCQTCFWIWWAVSSSQWKQGCRVYRSQQWRAIHLSNVFLFPSTFCISWSFFWDPQPSHFQLSLLVPLPSGGCDLWAVEVETCEHHGGIQSPMSCQRVVAENRQSSKLQCKIF